MTSPRYVPRTFLKGHHAFGRVSLPDSAWKSASGKAEEVQVRAARMQHALVLAIREAMSLSGARDSDISLQCGFSELRWQRVLRGDVVLRLEDLATVETVTGYRVTIMLEAADVNGAAARRLQARAEERRQASTTRNTRAQSPRHQP